MSNEIKFRTADQQCFEYVAKQRAQANARRADTAALEALRKLSREVGVENATAAYLRLAGVMLEEGYDKALIVRMRRMLMRSIRRSVWRDLLTRWPIRH